MPPSATQTCPSANLLRRVAAFIYDAFLLFAITLAYGLLLLIIKILFNGTQQIEEIQPGPLLQWLSFAGWLIALMGYYYICWRKQGQTLGMKSWRLQLQQVDGTLATPEQCIKRSLLATLSLAVAGIGYLWCLLPSTQLRPSRACLHDIYSGTEVVVLPKENKKTP
jgi:uncharacterized RDD family membrane protein YckC